MPQHAQPTKDIFSNLPKINFSQTTLFTAFLNSICLKMKNSDLLQILQKLSPTERRALRKFVQSPWFNQREDVTQLLDFLDNGLKKTPETLTKAAAHEAIYPNLPYDDKQIRRLMSYLLKVVENFLTHCIRMEDVRQNDITLATAYRKLGLEKHARQALIAAEASLKTMQVEDENHYESLYLLEAETLAFSESAKRTAPRNLQAVSHSLDLAFLVRKLRQSSAALSHQAVTNIAYDLGLLNTVLDFLENSHLPAQQPAIGLYFYFCRAATTEDVSYFEKLKSGLLQHGGAFVAGELRNIYLLAINYCIRRINGGAARFNADLFELYTAALEKGILLENGQLSRFAFKNIAALALRLGEFAWTQSFIETYGPTLEGRHRRNYTDYNLAKLHYARRDFPKAMQLLHKVEYEDVFLSLDARVLLLKIYFEQGETEALESFIQSFQRFLNRKKELGYHRENYLNTLNFTNKLLNVNILNKNEKEYLRQEIEQTGAVGEKEWLLERLLNSV